MKKTFLKLSSLALCLLLLLSLLPVTAPAAEGVSATLSSVGDGLSPLERALYDGMMASEAQIDVSAFGADKETVNAAMQHLYYSVPELFHLEHGYSFSSIGGKVNAVIPSYSMAGTELEAARARYLVALDEILSGVDPTWPDALICLYLHDYLCTAFAYDTTLSVYDAYRFLTGGTGVCQSYTLTYIALLSHFDIPVTYATGEDKGSPHIWNIVYLDGIPYHVDVTWGDPLVEGEDAFGAAYHKSFLKSDAAIDAAGHGNRQNFGGIVCSDTRYDEIALTDVRTAAAILDGVAYGMADGRLYRLGATLLEETPLYTVEEEWRSGMQVLAEKPTGLASYGGLLYTNTPHTILAIDPVGGTAEAVHTVSGLLLGLVGRGDTLTYLEATSIFGHGATLGTHILPSALPPCTGEHTFWEYATSPASCSAEGVRYLRCTACGMRAEEAIPTLPHTYTTTVVPPTYGEGGYTKHVCDLCGHTETDSPQDPLPPPDTAAYHAAVAEALAATDAEGFLRAVSAARRMEAYLDSEAIAADRAALDEACLTYNERVEAINTGFGNTLFSLLFTDTHLLTSATSVLAVLALVFRRILGS